MLSGHGPGGVDVVGDDEEGRVDLGVEVDEELVDVRRADRVQAGVRLVDEEDLRVEDEGPGEAGALAHPAGDLAGQLVLGAGETDELHLLAHDGGDLGLALAGVLAQREGDVVEEAHRAEEGAVLEEHPEELADLVEVVSAELDDVAAVDDDRAGVGADQADQGLEEDRLAGAGRAEHHRDLPRGEGEGDVVPDELAPEPLGQAAHRDLDTHVDPSRRRAPTRAEVTRR